MLRGLGTLARLQKAILAGQIDWELAKAFGWGWQFGIRDRMKVYRVMSLWCLSGAYGALVEVLQGLPMLLSHPSSPSSFCRFCALVHLTLLVQPSPLQYIPVYLHMLHIGALLTGSM